MKEEEEGGEREIREGEAGAETNQKGDVQKEKCVSVREGERETVT